MQPRLIAAILTRDGDIFIENSMSAKSGMLGVPYEVFETMKTQLR